MDNSWLVALPRGKKDFLDGDGEGSFLSKILFCNAADAKNKTRRFTLFHDSSITEFS